MKIKKENGRVDIKDYTIKRQFEEPDCEVVQFLQDVEDYSNPSSVKLITIYRMYTYVERQLIGEFDDDSIPPFTPPVWETVLDKATTAEWTETKTCENLEDAAHCYDLITALPNGMNLDDIDPDYEVPEDTIDYGMGYHSILNYLNNRVQEGELNG